MNVKEIMNNIKGFITAKKEQFKALSKEKRIAIIIGVITVVLAIAFSIIHNLNNKYQVLFSGLDSNDATTITKELESRGITTKIEGDSIYVPKEEVDKLRLELSGSISNGSKGFELMDEGSSFGMTDEEFQIKKQRMTQGEIEKTIKTFPQVEDARVHITNGEESVFANESVPGTAAVYLNVKVGSSLDESQVRSIMSLVSASTSNIPKQNVEVIDQNMNLLSDGLYDEDGNAKTSNTSGIDIARNAEKELNSDLEKSVLALLEPVFGQGKVKAKVNADLNFDTSEQTEVKIDPEKVIIKEERSENTSSDDTTSGGAVDNNMNNVGDAQGSTAQTREESIEYEVGRLENKVIKAQGELNKITASVAIDGNLDAATMRNVENMVANAIGLDEGRGDSISIVGMNFAATNADANALDGMAGDSEVVKVIKTVGAIVGVLLILIITILIAMYIINKKKNSELENVDEDFEIDIINQKLEEMEMNRANSVEEDEENITLEEEVREYASENPDQVTEMINSWLNE